MKSKEGMSNGVNGVGLVLLGYLPTGWRGNITYNESRWSHFSTSGLAQKYLPPEVSVVTADAKKKIEKHGSTVKHTTWKKTSMS